MNVVTLKEQTPEPSQNALIPLFCMLMPDMYIRANPKRNNTAGTSCIKSAVTKYQYHPQQPDPSVHFSRGLKTISHQTSSYRQHRPF